MTIKNKWKFLPFSFFFHRPVSLTIVFEMKPKYYRLMFVFILTCILSFQVIPLRMASNFISQSPFGHSPRYLRYVATMISHREGS